MLFKKQDLIDLIHIDEPEGFSIVEEGDWVSKGKCELIKTIFKYEDKFYCVYCARSGSYHTDWYYDYEDWAEFEECSEVKQVEVTVTQWRTV